MADFNIEAFKKLPKEAQRKCIEPHLDRIGNLVLERTKLALFLSTIFVALIALGSFTTILPPKVSLWILFILIICIPIPIIIANWEFKTALKKHREIVEEYLGSKIDLPRQTILRLILSYYIDFFICVVTLLSLVIAYYISKCL